MGWDNWGGFAPYVSKAEKLKRAEKARAALVKKGIRLEPVLVEGRPIAKSWWGKAWTDNLERYADYENRIPRGRTYVRSGAVLDLKILPNKISALVSGSGKKPYNIEIAIASLDKKNVAALQDKSRTSLDSMQALLSGEFPPELKECFFRQGSGLFPSPKEIKLDCTCLDWADMCKHVAAALYGTAVRLDDKPELFFVLRGMDIHAFVGKMVAEEGVKLLKKAYKKSTRAMVTDTEEAEALFGISMDVPEVVEKKSVRRSKIVVSKKTETRTPAKLVTRKKTAEKKKEPVPPVIVTNAKKKTTAVVKKKRV